MKRTAFFITAILAASSLLGQVKGVGTTSGGTSGTSSSPVKSLPTTTSSPSTTGTPTSSSSTTGNSTRGIFISGQVVMADGSPVPQNVTILRTCGGNPRTVAYADIKGTFTFQWSQQDAAIVPDASEAGITGRTISSGGSGSSAPSLIGCDLRANLAGYRSDRIDLGRFSMDSPDVGMIVLHRNAGGKEERTVSATSLMAPKDARKAFERGQLALLKNKPDQAEKDFENAVAKYPRYAEAWLSLGKLRLDRHQTERARAAFLKTIEADPKIFQPYLELGLLSADEKNWEDTRKYLEHAIRMDPSNYPVAWYYTALSYYNLKKYDEAEKDVRQAIKLDPRHGMPREQYLLGLLLEHKRDFAGAAIELTAYLKLAPAAPDFMQVEAEVKQLQKIAGESKQAAK